jgi:hypothetical protein
VGKEENHIRSQWEQEECDGSAHARRAIAKEEKKHG